jgi:hypothetical protein
MGNTNPYSSRGAYPSSAIARQEAYVDQEMAKINQNTNYCRIYGFRETTYSDRQLRGKLREEYNGYTGGRYRDSYVLSQDWERISKSRRGY